MTQSKTIVITGNHHTPAIELIHQLKTDKIHPWNIIYISRLLTQETHLAHTILPQKDIQFYNLTSGKFDRRQITPTLLGLPQTLFAIFYSTYLLFRHRPDIVVSFGGYSSIPVIFSAWLQKIPSITHEQTLTNSLTTKINSLFVSKVALSFDNPQQIKQLPANKTVVTGNLLRHEIYQNNFPGFLNSKFLNSKLPLIYITGGNQGSHYINQIIQDLLPKLKEYLIIHQLGPQDFPNSKKTANYFPVDYISTTNIGWIFHHTSLIISRAGANTCQEIANFGLPAILIPLPYSQQDEQVKNALWLKELQPKKTKIIHQSELNEHLLHSTIKQLINLPSRPSRILPQVNHKFIDLIHELVK